MRIFALLLLLLSSVSQAERIKDIASIYGIRENKLIGYGLVVGLDGTGDKSGQRFTEQSFRNMLTQLGINVPSGLRLNSKNIAAVTVTATLPPFAKQGQAIDVTVSSIGTAKSLRGGTLLMTPLKAVNGQVYALAQGNLVVGGFGASGKDGSKISVNIPSVGRIPNGGLIEREVGLTALEKDYLIYNLHQYDFTSAKRMAEAVNRTFGKGTAAPVDATSVKVKLPVSRSQKVEFISVVENLELTPGKSAAKVIINARTGTVVIGELVMVSPAAVSHGNLIVTISENQRVSQPTVYGASQHATIHANPDLAVNNTTSQRGSEVAGNQTTTQTSNLSGTVLVNPQTTPNQAAGSIQTNTTLPNVTAGIKTQVIESSDIAIEQEKNRAFVFERGTSLRDIVKTINAVGAAPADLVAILEALREVGALNAELIII